MGSDGADDSFGYIHTSVQNDVGSDGADDSRESRRSPSRREQEDEEPFERSVKEGSGGGATKPPGDNGTEGCSSWLAPVGTRGAVVSTCMQGLDAHGTLRVAPRGSHFGRILGLPSLALGTRPPPPSRAAPGAREAMRRVIKARRRVIKAMRRLRTP